jgi:hypothetical protein
VICAGSNIPALSNSGVPSLGTKFSVDLANGRANAPAIFIIGLSKTAWGTTRLPWDLASLGAGGCKLYVSLDVEFGTKTDGSGKISYGFTVPNDSRLRGFKFYNQYAVLRPQARHAAVAQGRDVAAGADHLPTPSHAEEAVGRGAV